MSVGAMLLPTIFAFVAGAATARVRVLLDGKPTPAAIAGRDVKDGVVTVTQERLYDLLEQDAVEEHLITLMPEEGVTGYAFSFG